MDGSVIETPEIFVGIDVSKSSWDVHVLPNGLSFSIRVDDGAATRLLEKLGSPKAALVVLEATGGLERQLVGELIDAGWSVAVVNPRQVRDFAKARWAGSRRRTASMPKRWLYLHIEFSRGPRKKRPKNSRNSTHLVYVARQLIGLRSHGKKCGGRRPSTKPPAAASTDFSEFSTNRSQLWTGPLLD